VTIYKALPSRTLTLSRKLSMVRLLLLLLAATFTAQVHAQSCPRADSALGSKADGYLRTKYDQFTDSTNIESASEGDITMFSQAGGAVITFYSHYKSKTAREAPTSEGKIVLIAARGHSGRRRSLGDETVPDVSMAKYQDVDAVNVLLDDSVRLTRPVTRHNAAMRQGNGLEDQMLLETLYLTVTTDDLVRIGSAKKAAIRIGDLTKKISDRVVKSIREQARTDMCAFNSAS
jgi:hypothetical protein